MIPPEFASGTTPSEGAVISASLRDRDKPLLGVAPNFLHYRCRFRAHGQWLDSNMTCLLRTFGAYLLVRFPYSYSCMCQVVHRNLDRLAADLEGCGLLDFR